MASPPPRIFSGARRRARRRRALALQHSVAEPARFVLDDMIEDVGERLAFLRHEPNRSMVVGDWSGQLAAGLPGEVLERDIAGPDALDFEHPWPVGDFDCVVVLGLLDTVNDLPGALIHIRESLAPDGLAIACFPGSGSLPALRHAMLAAEPDRPAARLHPMVDSRAGAQLLQRAGWRDPVVDSHDLTVRYSSLDRLIGDLREQGLGNVLADPAPPLGEAAMQRARAAFTDLADPQGRVSETFSILTLSGRRAKPRF
ncbi:methyltransferase domain-containing protein [Aurantiacibacter spongiae]|uniref:Methyltransferase domain-containing protein n=1 Tax=Aurantiacibacter spongiae TaxID=2488860 RepID=A0A3N5CUK8_9SPHN|nr:methyltransferase domain-containing protein [Aurantiacibacter spongiae]RPF70309.1 methyltransferase domain-containing protein [Aurantiacibacter spongiae]